MEDFDQIYRQYYKQIYFYVLGMCRDNDIAEEITQETFFKVLSKIDTFHGDSGIYTWMVQIAKNTYFNYCRKKKVIEKHEQELPDEQESVEQQLIKKETLGELHLLLHNLQEPYREVFWMRTFGELSFQEIGRIHKKTESWARVTYHRAKVMLKEAVK